MAFSKKTWKDRVSQYINRRLLTDSDGNTQQVTVTRDEGSVTEAGDAFSASNMNDLEDRIDTAFGALTAADIPYSQGVSVADKLDNVPTFDTLTTGDNNKLLGVSVSGSNISVGAVKQLHIESGLATAQPNSYVRVTFSTPYTTVPRVSITPVNNTSPREYLRACTITTITATYFEFAEVAIKASDKSFVNGSDSCSWVAYGV